ncbi:MAG: IS200/IS605 family transposase [Bacteroidota bacterium]|nr:IS200/IS605 family transposase [Bacteroidota bacterium]
MANTYTKIFYHVIFAVRNRDSLIIPAIKNDLFKYITGIVTNQNQNLFIINGMPDHIHILMNCKPNMNLSDNIREIKEHSTKFINDKKILRGKFYWQEGFGAFTVSIKDVAIVLNYIKNQEEHHKNKSFKEEYLEFLKESEIKYRDELIFDFELK